MERFGITIKEPIVGPIVHEFYASFRDQESRGPYDAIWEIITVRGEEGRNLNKKMTCEYPICPQINIVRWNSINHLRCKEEEGNDDYKEEEEEEEDREQDS
ncbi:hypothetical protein Goari_018002 [Gossypium aridum]|uniref:Uncharacterized protein n=1 Tax=Gossypium aridum TaxID=34290 RepID=A0A7J8WNC0_GOSAI|nr:hypothetical protein [Gossypium aridum]